MRSSFVSQVPIAQTSEDKIQIFIILVEYIIYFENELKQKESDNTSSIRLARDKMMVRFFEQIINGMVYELYLSEELQMITNYPAHWLKQFLSLLLKSFYNFHVN